MKKNLLALAKIAALSSVLGLFLTNCPHSLEAFSQQIIPSNRPTQQSGIVSGRINIDDSSTLVDLGKPVSRIVLWSDGGSANIYISPAGGTATTSNAMLAGGAGVTLDDLPRIKSFTFIGASATGVLNYVAW